MLKNSKIKKIGEKTSPHRLQMAIALGIILLGVLIMFVLIKLKRPPKRAEQETLTPLVKIEKLNVQDIRMVVSGYGTVSPKVQVEIVPQVSGKVVSINSQFKAGGFIPANEELVKMDPRDYELAVLQAKAGVAEAIVTLDMEKAEAQVVREEWEQLHPNTEPTSPLVLRQPQIQQAQARLESAKAALATAKLNLERTRLSLPLDVRIVSDKVDLGQYVMVGQSIGVAYGIETVEIEVPLEDRELAWFDVPDNTVSFNGNTPSKKTTAAQVKANFAGANRTWTGYVTRTTGQVDKISRLISVVVEVPKPFDTSDKRTPLLPGTFVEVFIEGNVLKNAVAVPRDAIHQNNKIWVVNQDHLYIKPLEIVRTDKDFAYAVSGIDDNAAIVVSSMDIVTDGMKVRVRSQAGETEAD